MKIEKTPEGAYRISGGGKAVGFDKEQYEDLFYAVPLDSTSFYRLLTEAVCRTEDERREMVDMINGLEDQEKGLSDLQKQIQDLGI